MSAEESHSTDQTKQTSSTDPTAPARHGLPARPPAAQNAAIFAFKPRAVLPVSRSTPSTANVNDSTYYASPTADPVSSASAPDQDSAAQLYSGFGASAPNSYGAGYTTQQDYSTGLYPVDQGQAGYYSNPYGQEYNANQWQNSDAATPTSAGPSKGSVPKAKPQRADNKTVIRTGGGKTWEDPTLLDWPEDHHCLFIGNLAGEVTDESLFKAFGKYSSLSKARVIRDSSTSKSKGFGFVSLGDSDEYFQAAKEMSGKYIGSHPVTISRANKGATKKGAYKVVEKDARYYKKYHGKKSGQQPGAGSASGSGGAAQTKTTGQQSQDPLRADPSGGIRKNPKGSKIKMLG